MKRKSIGTHYSLCVQPTFIIGTYNEDGQPNFAPITWVSAACEKGYDYILVISMHGTKRTKQNIFRTCQLSVNLASTDMLELVDYFGNSSAKNNNKETVAYSYSDSEYVHAPTLDASHWVYECEVIKTVPNGESDTFFCRIKNVQIDETICVKDTFDINLVSFDPIIYSGQYHSIGNYLGKIGDYYKDS